MIKFLLNILTILLCGFIIFTGGSKAVSNSIPVFSNMMMEIQTVLQETPVIPDSSDNGGSSGGEQGGDVGGIIPHAGGIEPAIFLPDGQFFRFRENHIRMGHIDPEVIPALAAKGQHHIQRPIDLHMFRPLGNQPVPDKFGPFLFLMGGGRDGSKGFQQLKLLIKPRIAPLENFLLIQSRHPVLSKTADSPR